MIKIDKGQVVEYIMEPEEELLTLRFLARHRPSRPLLGANYWKDCVPYIPDKTAEELGLTGGYTYHFHELTGGSFC